MNKIHIIACGGAVMHNIAIALHSMGHTITGSDDEIFEPALGRLKKHNLCPPDFGWFPDKINSDLDFVILGMHARADNPELLKAKELGLKIYSFPDYVYEHAIDKKRIVIAGSHGKTTTTAMVMHVLKELNYDFDYLVGSQLAGFDTMVRFSNAPIMVIEGDEYLTSTLDPVPKFLKYKPHIAMITGIAWDHINVFPVYEDYVHQFELFINEIQKDGKLIYFSGDEELNKLAENTDIECIKYKTPNYHIRNGKVVVSLSDKYELEIFGDHNLQNAEGARLVCQAIGIDESAFYNALKSFTGTAKRLEKMYEEKNFTVYRDFAHSPSKLKATVEAVRNKYPDAEIFSIFELHTFSSLNKKFLPHYQQCMEKSDHAMVYFNPNVFELKKLQPLDIQFVEKSFGGNVKASNQIEKIIEKISLFKSNVSPRSRVLLVMSSGNFDNAQLW
jgi:UDP-N-acetylmuramate: L-alanyl-gamma-D-glutamyl-meso-diaminopimelate ligase